MSTGTNLRSLSDRAREVRKNRQQRNSSRSPPTTTMMYHGSGSFTNNQLHAIFTNEEHPSLGLPPSSSGKVSPTPPMNNHHSHSNSHSNSNTTTRIRRPLKSPSPVVVASSLDETQHSQRSYGVPILSSSSDRSVASMGATPMNTTPFPKSVSAQFMEQSPSPQRPQRRIVSPEKQPQPYNHHNSNISSNRSVVSDTYLLHSSHHFDLQRSHSHDSSGNTDADDDIPMDERSADVSASYPTSRTNHNGIHSHAASPRRPPMVVLHNRRSLTHHNNNSNNSHANTVANHHSSNTHNHGNTTTNNTNNDDDVSSLGGVEDTGSNLVAMTTALRSRQYTNHHHHHHHQNRATPLHGLSPEERVLWDTVQQLLKEQHEQILTMQNHNTTLVDANSFEDDDNENDTNEKDKLWERKLAQQQREQEVAMRAIQRVLADVTTERDEALAHIQEWKDAPKHAMEEKKQEVEDDKPSPRVRELETDLLEKESQLTQLQQQVQDLQVSHEEKDRTVQHYTKEIAQLKRQSEQNIARSFSDDASTRTSLSTQTELEKDLKDKTVALENAKMIITSLENASGSMASDTRTKLKVKESEITNLQAENKKLKRSLDTLAMELRDAQSHAAESEDFKIQLNRHSSELKAELGECLADLRSASTILETTQDASSISNLAELFEDCHEALKLSLEVLDGSGDDGSETVATMESNRSSVSRKQQIAAMEEAVKRAREEARHYHHEAERAEKKRKEDRKKLFAEIQLLRVECSTNMEVLAKKERELAVLRDSLKVEDEEVGYISDDASEGDEEDGAVETSAPPPSTAGHRYSSSQAEALAALLAHGGPNGAVNSTNVIRSTGDHGTISIDSESIKGELAQAKVEKERMAKELKTEKESLANAKMIISSLEKANKSMMEDLRSRLYDSNTAIASLLEKSMASEKTTAKLQAELEALRKEKAKNEQAMRQGGGGGSRGHRRLGSESSTGSNILRAMMATETID